MSTNSLLWSSSRMNPLTFIQPPYLFFSEVSSPHTVQRSRLCSGSSRDGSHHSVPHNNRVPHISTVHTAPGRLSQCVFSQHCNSRTVPASSVHYIVHNPWPLFLLTAAYWKKRPRPIGNILKTGTDIADEIPRIYPGIEKRGQTPACFFRRGRVSKKAWRPRCKVRVGKHRIFDTGMSMCQLVSCVVALKLYPIKCPRRPTKWPIPC
jgi:hypothetical protein